MLQTRPKTWAIFAAICMVMYLVSFVLCPTVISFFAKTAELQNYRNQLKEEQSQQSTQTTEPIVDGDENAEESEDVTKAFNKMVETISYLGRYLGIVVCVYGIFRFVLAFSRDDPEAISSAVPMMIVGALLVGFSAIAPKMFGG